MYQDHKSRVLNQVIVAYRAAHYSFEAPDEQISFRVGTTCPGAAKLIEDSGGPGVFHITAYNPKGLVVNNQVNDAASVRLRKQLRAVASSVLPATGADFGGKWESEPGFMALGLSLDAAEQLGKQFCQNAVVWIGPDGVPKLILLR